MMEEEEDGKGNKCLICSCVITTTNSSDHSTRTRESSKGSNDFSSSSVSSSTTKHQFHRQLYVIFILRNILELPVHQLASHLRNNWEIQYWISLCDNCDALGVQCREIFDQLVKISKKFKLCQQNIIKIVRKNGDDRSIGGPKSRLPTSNSSNGDKKTLDNNSFVEKIRNFVQKNDYEHLTDPLEKTRPWTSPNDVKREVTPQNDENLVIKTEPDEEFNDWPHNDDNFSNNENSMEASPDTRESEEDEWQQDENTENEDDEPGCGGSEEKDKLKNLDGEDNKRKRRKRTRLQKKYFSCPLCQVYKKRLICEKTVLFICFHLDKCLKRCRVKNGNSASNDDDDIAMLKCGFCSMYSCSVNDIFEFVNHLVSCIFKFTPTPLQHRIFKCNICSVEKCGRDKYFNLDGFLSHYSYHHSIKYECIECRHLMSTTDQIHAHLRRHHKDLAGSLVDYSTCVLKLESPHYPAVPWWCSVCGDVFMEEEERDEHLHSEHHPLDSAKESEKKKGKCQFCEKFYNCSDELKLHQATAHTLELNPLHQCEQRSVHSKNFSCHVCEKGFTLKRSLQRHLANIHRIGRFLEKELTCPVEGCGKVYRYRSPFKDHIATHEKKTVYSCTFCDKEFCVESSLIHHVKFVHDESTKKFQCEKCPYKTGHKYHFHKHKRRCHLGKGKTTMKGANPIDQNSKQFQIRKQLEEYKRRKKNIRKIKQGQCKVNATKMDNCGTEEWQSLTSRKNETESGNNDVTARQKKSTIKVICQICGRTFKSRTILKRHQENALQCKQLHMSMEEATVVCHLCGGRFSNKRNLEKHVREQHERIHKVACEHCGKGFNARNEYKEHLAITHQTGEYYDNKERFKCPVEGCGKILFRAGSRKRHIEHHNELEGEPQFKCEHCGKAFSSVHYRYMHVRTVHQGYKYKKKPKSSGNKFASSKSSPLDNNESGAGGDNCNFS